jgi:transposase
MAIVRADPDPARRFDILVSIPCVSAITAIMRKIIVIANALLRDNRKWSQSHP